MLGAIIGVIIGILTSKNIFFIFFLVFPFIRWHKDFRKLLILLLFFIYGFLICLLTKVNTFSSNTYLLVIEAKENYVIARNLFSKCYILAKGNDLEIGDVIKVDGIVKELDMHAIESHFDFKNYLNNNGIYYEFSVGKMEKILSLFFPIKKIAVFLTNKYDQLTGELAKSLVFGYNSKTINNLFSNNSFRYMLTLNSSILAFEMYLIVNLFKKVKSKIIKILISIIGSLLFILLCFKKALLKNQTLEEFDREIFESIVEKVIIGGYDENGKEDPYKIIFIYKTGFKDEIENAKKRYENTSGRVDGKLCSYITSEVKDLYPCNSDNTHRPCWIWWGWRYGWP